MSRTAALRSITVAEQKVSDWQMNASTLRTCDVVRDQ